MIDECVCGDLVNNMMYGERILSFSSLFLVIIGFFSFSVFFFSIFERGGVGWMGRWVCILKV